MRHLSPEELVDALDGMLPDSRLAHLDRCELCQREHAVLRAISGEVRAPEVPEPSPLFWERLSDRVRTAIATEPVTRQQPRWFEWPVLVPLAALALLVVSLGWAIPTLNDLRSATAQTTVAGTADLPATGDFNDFGDRGESQWALVAELLGDLDVDDASAAGIGTMPGSADRVVFQLTSSEQQELVRLLNEELKAGS